MENLKEHEFTTEELEKLAPRSKINWPLIIGLFIILGIIILAIFGPKLAPKDPMEEVQIVKIEGEWEIPPFRIFTPGYPLGSDQFGRDLWSRLLWGIKPTLIMVISVAMIRLLLGVTIGLFAGWLNNWFGRFLENLIEGAISIPVLLVALGVIAAVGQDLGIWAFVIGLSLTGWVESAQQVQEQTRIIKGQTYIEAAKALGSSNTRILIAHILRQILPMVLMLFAFEISSTLMTTAGLGFLGYYIGGDVWVEVGDFVARRISSMPELGQMLATSWVLLTEPWAMVAVGTTIFITILGFNLIGEGLRVNLNVVSVRRGFSAQLSHKVVFWFDQNVFHPVIQFLNFPLVRRLGFLVGFFLFVWFFGYRFLWLRIENIVQNLPGSEPILAVAEAESTSTQENQLVDFSTEEVEESKSEIEYFFDINWEVNNDDSFRTGAEFDDARNRFYTVTTSGMLQAYSTDGELIWESQIPEFPHDEGPVIGENGEIFVADSKAGISAFSQQGEFLWHFVSEIAPNTVSGPVLFDDTVYYVVSNFNTAHIQAINTLGEALWSVQVNTGNYFFPLSISNDGNFLFLREDVIDTQNQILVDIETDLIPYRFFGGEDGNYYMLSGQYIYQVDIETNPLEIIDTLIWDYEHSGVVSGFQNVPQDIDISTSQDVRLFYTTPGGSSGAAWVDFEGELLGSSGDQISGSTVQAEYDFENIVICGGRSFAQEFLKCALLRKDLSEPIATIDLGSNGPALGGFWHENVVTFTTGTGAIFALSFQETEVVVQNESGSPKPEQNRGIIWSYPLDSRVKYGPFVLDNGSVLLISHENELVILNSDGTQKLRREIYKSWYALIRGRGYTDVIQPYFLSGDVFVTFAQDQFVYAEDAEGNLLWEFQMENPMNDFPYQIDESIYVVDTKGNLLAIDNSGLRWVFTPDNINRPASGLVVGQDKTVYYTLSNVSKGFIQAVSRNGVPLWQAELLTDSFYDPLHVSGDGKYIFINNEIRKTIDGSLVEYNFPVPISEFLVGGDGLNYLRTAEEFMQWQMGPNGIDILNSFDIQTVSQNLYAPIFRVDADSKVWIYMFSGGMTNIIFMKPDGEFLGQQRVSPQNLTYSVDEINLIYKICRSSDSDLSCGKYDPSTDKFEPEFSIANVPEFATNEWHPAGNGVVLILTRDDHLVKLYLGE